MILIWITQVNYCLNCTQAQTNGKEQGVVLFLRTILVVPQQYKSVSMLYIKQFFNKVFFLCLNFLNCN